MRSLPTLLFLVSNAVTFDTAWANETSLCSWPQAMPATRLMLVGEIHGTDEAPALIGALACATAKTGRSVIVALEVPVEEQARLDRFLMSEGLDNDQAELLRGTFWNRATQDGRSSGAMLKLLHRLRALRAERAGIRVLAVDDSSARTRDAGMAGYIRMAHGQGSMVIALLGNVHASRNKGRRSKPDYEPAGYLLTDLDPLSVYVGGPAGTAWVCAPQCGVMTLPRNRVVGQVNGYKMADGSIPGYSGLYGTTKTTASPPAVR